MTLSVLVVDDEPPARDKIRRFLEDDARFVVVGEVGDGLEALEAIERLAPNVLVLDVQMPGLDGFQVLDALGDESDFVVVFSTAYDVHALRAFEAHAVDYLLKPYDAERFRRAMTKAAAQYLGGVRERRLWEPGAPAQLTVRTAAGAWTSVPLGDILRLRASNKHTQIAVAGAEPIVVRRALADLEPRLGGGFLRVHRNEIVRVRAVRGVDSLTHGDALLTFTDGSSSVLTRTYRAAFLRAWQRP